MVMAVGDKTDTWATRGTSEHLGEAVDDVLDLPPRGVHLMGKGEGVTKYRNIVPVEVSSTPIE